MYKQINYTEAKELISEGRLIIADVRDLASFETEHIKDAIHLSIKALNAFCEETAPDTAILVYCYHGISSQSVAQHLVDQGFMQVYSLIGGFEAWKSQHSTSGTNK
jgi:thiosulfate sulfurtransferase